MNIRKDPLANGRYYHIYSRSIAKYIIFNNEEDFSRLLSILDLYRYINFNYKYSKFIELKNEMQQLVKNDLLKQNQTYADIVAYCVMPTHIHLILKQNIEGGITKYVGKVLNSYSKYFNSKHHRAGPLWEGNFKNVLVSDDEQLLHLTRYIHLNPTSASLVEKLEDWNFSSYLEYINPEKEDGICDFNGLFEFTLEQYKKFVNDRKSYQKELSIIKNILIDNYAG